MGKRTEDKGLHKEKGAPVVGGDEGTEAETDNEQGTLRTWDAALMTLGALQGFKQSHLYSAVLESAH